MESPMSVLPSSFYEQPPPHFADHVFGVRHARPLGPVRATRASRNVTLRLRGTAPKDEHALFVDSLLAQCGGAEVPLIYPDAAGSVSDDGAIALRVWARAYQENVAPSYDIVVDEVLLVTPV